MCCSQLTVLQSWKTTTKTNTWPLPVLNLQCFIFWIMKEVLFDSRGQADLLRPTFLSRLYRHIEKRFQNRGNVVILYIWLIHIFTLHLYIKSINTVHQLLSINIVKWFDSVPITSRLSYVIFYFEQCYKKGCGLP